MIEQTVRQTLPEGFQRSEFLLDHGALDMIVDRRELRNTLYSILSDDTRLSFTKKYSSFTHRPILWFDIFIEIW